MAEAIAAIQDPYAVRFDAAGVSGAVRPLRTGRDKLYRGIVLGKLYAAMRRQGGETAELIGYRVCEVYAALCVCTAEVTGFAFPPLSAEDTQIADSFSAWLDLPTAAYDAMYEAHDAANKPTNDPDLLPPGMVSEEKKEKSPKSASSSGGGTTNA